MTDPAPAQRFCISREFKIVVIIALAGSALCASVGISGDVSLGDEIYHYFMAKHWAEGGTRPVFDPLIHASQRAQRRYMAAPLWHGGLVGLWSVTGVGKAVAQLYQAFWYIVLVLGVYDCGRVLYDRRAGMWAAGLIASMPFVAAFTSMFYIETMLMALAALMLGCLLRRRFVIAAVLLGLAFVTKRNAYFMVPGFVFLVVMLAGGSWKRRVLWIGLCGAIALAVHMPDLLWRHTNLGSLTHPRKGPAPAVDISN
ncbi:MAG: glycosyltransferase family 39 protein, partial [Planctomycetia bacterium]|nr:glycosyltransferase family 39 protein [Planctomycetia bacterium]